MQPINGNRATLFKKFFVRPKTLVSFKSKFNSTSFTKQSISNYAMISAVLTMFQFSVRISRIWMIANTFGGFTKININIMSTTNQSNSVVNTKTKFNNTVNMDINMVNMAINSTEKKLIELSAGLRHRKCQPNQFSPIPNSNIPVFSISIFRIPTNAGQKY